MIHSIHFTSFIGLVQSSSVVHCLNDKNSSMFPPFITFLLPYFSSIVNEHNLPVFIAKYEEQNLFKEQNFSGALGINLITKYLVVKY